LDAEPENGILHWMKTRFLSLLMVLTLGALGLVAFALSFMLSTVGHFFEQYVAEFGRAASLSQLLLGFVLTPLLIALMFKVLPDAHVAWRDVLLGAFVTALLLRVGVYVLSFFMGRYVVGSIYGAAGALVGILFFVYYVAQMLFLGAEFTRVYAMQHGRGIRPYDRAVLWVREKPLALPAPAPIAPPPPPVPAVLPPLPPEETPARKLEKRTAVGLLSMAVVMFVAFLIGRKSA
jgi:membrane protein